MTVDGHGEWQGPHMDPIGSAERRVTNRFEAEFVPFIVDGEPSPGEWILQLDGSYPLGAAFTSTAWTRARGPHPTSTPATSNS